MTDFILPLDNLNCDVKIVFGNDYIVYNTERILGGAQKLTYKATCSNGFVFVLYIWNESANFLSKFETKDDIFTSSSPILFEENNKFLIENDILTPKIYYINTKRNIYNFDYAFIQYINGYDMDWYFLNRKNEITKIMKKININLERLHSQKRELAGTIRTPQNHDFICKEYIRTKIHEDTEYLLKNFDDTKLYQHQLLKLEENLFNAIHERHEYTFIHWELGPNHVIVDKNLNPYFIDIEGAKYFDLELEHSFLEFRFGSYYKYLKNDNLDTDRFKYYKLYHHIWVLTGAHQLSINDYYDIQEVNNMIKFNYNQIKTMISK